MSGFLDHNLGLVLEQDTGLDNCYRATEVPLTQAGQKMSGQNQAALAATTVRQFEWDPNLFFRWYEHQEPSPRRPFLFW